MKRRTVHGTALILLVSCALHGCGAAKGDEGTSAKTAPEKTVSKTSTEAAPPVDSSAIAASKMPRVSDRPGNTKGRVFIVEYHHIRTGKGSMFRTTEQFKSDLDRFYKDGFRPITVSDYLSGKMPVPPGASPMAFTFDDANPSQLRLLPDGKVDPECAVGIWQEFAKEHPDFPVRATFFVLPTMWGQKEFVTQKVQLLRSLGCELGNHTMTHPILRKLSDDKVKWEIGTAAENLEKLGEKPPFVFAFPFGVSPKNRSLVKGFDFNGKHVENKAALLVGAEPAPSPEDPKLNVLRIPRVQACKDPSGTDDWMNQFEAGHVKVYVQP